MTPDEYARIVVLPAVKDFMAARAERRLAYVACIATYHLVDHVAHAKGRKDNRSTWSEINSVCGPSWIVVQGFCNGTKHPRPQTISPGAERDVPVFAFDVPGAGWGQGRWDVPGLDVESNGARLFVDWCVQAVLRSFVGLYPDLFPSVDLTFLDTVFRDAAPISASTLA